MSLPFLTIGHSNRTLDEFRALLRGAAVEHLADIRQFTRSRSNPQFNQETLSLALGTIGISYQHVVALGGRRGKDCNVPREVNGFWTHDSFHNYADYALSEPFQAALDLLRAEGRTRRTAIMCSEAVWWRCHRRIVTDYLLARGEQVLHIMGEGRLDEATMTPGAVAMPDGTVVYPGAQAPGQ